MASNQLSIVIPVHKPRYLALTLDSLIDQSNQNFEVILVENGGANDTPQLVKQYEHHLDVRSHFDPQAGTNRARDTGTHLAKYDLIALIDQDICPNTKWVASVLQAHADYPEAGIIGGKVFPRFLGEQPTWWAGSLGWIGEFTYGDSYLELQGGFDHDQSFLAGANMSYRRSIFDKAGGFGTNLSVQDAANVYFIHANDEFIFTEKARQVGSPGLLYCPFMEVTHLIPPERTTLEAVQRRAYTQGVADVAYYKYLKPTYSEGDLVAFWKERLNQETHIKTELDKYTENMNVEDKSCFTIYFLSQQIAYLEGVRDGVKNDFAPSRMNLVG